MQLTLIRRLPLLFNWAIIFTPALFLCLLFVRYGAAATAALLVLPLAVLIQRLRLLDCVFQSKSDCKRVQVKKRVCVVGAGPSGLVATKELLEQGHAVICYEASASLGGTFAHGAYDSTQLTSSPAVTAFSDFPAYGQHRYWSKDEYVKYLSRYADAFRVRAAVHVGARVVALEEDEGGEWLVTVQDECKLTVSYSLRVFLVKQWRNCHCFVVVHFESND